MLLVDTKVLPSSIHGIGLFAAQDISRGTRVWEFTPGFDLHFTESQVRALPATARKQLENYCYKHLSKRTYVLVADDARFLNHSELPNITDYNMESLRDDAYSLANRDIKAGEELTVDYYEFDEVTRTKKSFKP